MYPIHREIEKIQKRTIKFTQLTPDGYEIETVVFIESENTCKLCISTQIGCGLGCTFCGTGRMGFIRNLTSDEIMGQVLASQQYEQKYNSKLTRVGIMGMGEPLLNLDNVLTVCQLLHDQGLAIHISTSGIIPGIKRLAEFEKLDQLFVSLHAPNNKLRSELMPINRKYPMEDLMASLLDYQHKCNKRIAITYTLLQGVNSDSEHAHELCEYLRPLDCTVHLSFYNECNLGNYKPPSLYNKNRFVKILREAKVPTFNFYSAGQSICAACGQLGNKTGLVEQI